MIRGSVNTMQEATVRLRLRGPSGVEEDVVAVVDTGFDDRLSLPISMPAVLGLTLRSTSQAILADGSVKWFEIFDAEVDWNGTWCPIQVSAIGDEVLVGMMLLKKHELRIEVVPGGAVEITPLP